jgi:dTDP-4-dehydrorhamnose 3,5-epimerase-like enzyme
MKITGTKPEGAYVADPTRFNDERGFFAPECCRGAGRDDPAFRIEWPRADVRVITNRDREYHDFKP